jgi:hypothetical protein
MPETSSPTIAEAAEILDKEHPPTSKSPEVVVAETPNDEPPPTILVEEVPMVKTPEKEPPVPPPPTPAAEETAEPGKAGIRYSIRCANQQTKYSQRMVHL